MSEDQSGAETPEQPAAPAPAPKRAKGRLPTGFATIRDVLSFIAGMTIIGNEVFVSKSVEPAAIAVGVTLTGLPLVFGADERKAQG